MKKHNFLFIILLGVIVSNCGGTKKDNNSLFTFDTTQFKAQYQPQEAIELSLLNPNSLSVDSVVFFVNETKIASTSGVKKINFQFKDQKLGYQNLKAIIYYEGKQTEASDRVELVSNVQPKLLNYSIVNTFVHDTTSFTEGLEFYNDTLFESTGQKGASYFRKYDFKNGKVFKQTNLDAKYFGEGITIVNNKLYQLTWQEKTGFIYDATTLELEKTFHYEKDIEGWGMTNDGKYIYQTDGTEKIWKMDPNTLKMLDYINVYSGNSKIKSINELEWINGKIYANVWQKDAVAVINPSNGVVENILDLSSLRKYIKNQSAEVLNGIAYNPKTNTLFVTGKNWEKMFELKISK